MSDFGETLVWWGSVIWDFLKLLVYTVYLYTEALFKFIFPPAPKSLYGEKILITGAGSGIGREICLLLIDSGATLFCWDINKEGNEEIVQKLVAGGCEAHAYEIDISDRAQVEQTSAKMKKEHGNITIIINNAGIMPCHKFLDHNPREIERVFQINVLAHFWILREFLPNMIKSKRGHIVTLCSGSGIVPIRNIVPYCGTKYAVHGYVEALKDELAHSPENPDIKFTTVYPFVTKTGLMSGVKCVSRIPAILPILEPKDVAEKIVDGMRRNYEYVYVPGSVQFLGPLATLLRTKVLAGLMDVFDAGVEPEERIL